MSIVPNTVVIIASALFTAAGGVAHAAAPSDTLPASTARFTSPPPVDLIAKGVVIGGQFVNVGAVETIHTEKAKAYANGKCRFAFQYNVKNQGAAKTPAPFRNVVLWDGAVIDQRAGQLLNAGVARDYFFDAWLEPGSHLLTLRVDADHAVAERDETNNQRVTRVVLMGVCTDALTGRPAQPATPRRTETPPAAPKPLPGRLR